MNEHRLTKIRLMIELSRFWDALMRVRCNRSFDSRFGCAEIVRFMLNVEVVHCLSKNFEDVSLLFVIRCVSKISKKDFILVY